MSRFTYEGEEYDLVDPDTWTTLEAIRLETLSGRRVVELVQDLKDYGPMGLHGAVWISLRRAGLEVPWDELKLPWFETLLSVTGDPVTEPPDPSTASTEAPKAAKPRRSGPARSPKK